MLLAVHLEVPVVVLRELVRRPFVGVNQRTGRDLALYDAKQGARLSIGRGVVTCITPPVQAQRPARAIATVAPPRRRQFGETLSFSSPSYGLSRAKNVRM